MTTATKIDLWVDPGCPFTWRASRWLVDVAKQRDLDMQWHVMSLAILNEGKEIPPQFQERMAQGRVATRVMQAVRDGHGNEALARFYTELGKLVHEQDRDMREETFRQALGNAGLPAELATAGSDETHQAAVAASHDKGQSRVGEDAGSPITAINGQAGFFGPILSTVPKGDDGLRLFDAIVALSGIPAFSELKRARQAS